MGKFQDVPLRSRLKAEHDKSVEADKRTTVSHAFPPKKSLAVRLNLSENAKLLRKANPPSSADAHRRACLAGFSTQQTPPIIRKPRSNIPRRPRVFDTPSKASRRVKPVPSPSENDFLYILAQAGESLEREGKDEELEKLSRPHHSAPSPVRGRAPASTLRIKLKEGKIGLKSKSPPKASGLGSSTSSAKRSLSTKSLDVKPVKPATLPSLKKPCVNPKAPPRNSHGDKIGAAVPAAKKGTRPCQPEHPVLPRAPPACLEKSLPPSADLQQPANIPESTQAIELRDMKSPRGLQPQDDKPDLPSPQVSPVDEHLKVYGSVSQKSETKPERTLCLGKPVSRHEEGGASTDEEEGPESPHGSIGSKRAESPLAPGDAKRMRRIEANREAARQTIRRKRAQHDRMLHEEKDLEEENAVLRKEIHNSRQEVEGITANIAFLQALLKAAEEKRQRAGQHRTGDHRSCEARSGDNMHRSASDPTLEHNMGWQHHESRYEDNDSETSREIVEAGVRDHSRMKHGHPRSSSRHDYQVMAPSNDGLDGSRWPNQGPHMMPPWVTGMPPSNSGSSGFRPGLSKGPPGYIRPASQGFPGTFPPGISQPHLPPHEQTLPWVPGGPHGANPWTMFGMHPGQPGGPPFPNMPPEMMAALAASTGSPASAAVLAAAMAAGGPPPPGMPPSMPPGMAAAVAANPMFFAGSIGGPPPPAVMMPAGMPMPSVSSGPHP